MKIEIDPNAGFCFGVVNAIKKAEKNLSEHGKLYCIGDIVHNNNELNRLKNMGLQSIAQSELEKLEIKQVLFRAHGEPPSSYETAKKNNIEIIDATCPVVLNLQKRIKNASLKIRNQQGQILIYGKKDHAEVNGLLGQIQGNAIVIESLNDLQSVDLNRPVELFSQTTKTPEGFELIRKQLKKIMKATLKVHDTICRKVSNRIPLIKAFAEKHDVIIFVSGKNSSNGKLLFNICKNKNPNTYFISKIEDLKQNWFSCAKSVGISGATSTPDWLMNDIKTHIELNIQNPISQNKS